MASRARQVVVITGASAGVGRATARAFARRGARLGLIARGRVGLEEARFEAEDAGASALVLPADVANYEEVEAAAAKVEQELGPIDVWVNNAMVSVFSPAKQMQAQEYERVIQVNYLGYVNGTLAALERMLPRDRGVIVQVSSALAYRSIPLQSAYCASKHAIVGFTESLLSELRHDRSRVRLTMVHLPAINTPQFGWVRSRLPNEPQPVPPIFQPEVAARAIVWAAGHRRRAITVGSSSVKAVLGNRVAPGLLDRRLAKTGYLRQQTDAPADPLRTDNLLHPLPFDRGAHGTFDPRAHSFSLQLWANTHRRALFLSALAALGLLRLGRARRS